MKSESLAGVVLCSTSPLPTSVMVILYEVITPLCSSASGADQDSLILVELIATTPNDRGGPLGADRDVYLINQSNDLASEFHLPSSNVCMDICSLYGPWPTVTAVTMKE